VIAERVIRAERRDIPACDPSAAAFADQPEIGGK
jgi:hypothetical protein